MPVMAQPAISTTPVAESTPPDADSLIVLRGGTWADYQRVLELRGDRPVPRLAYLDGVLELMSPSHGHEAIKSMIGRLVEAWCMERGVGVTPYGSWTHESKEKNSGVEPDECYVFDPIPVTDEVTCPDLVIEVVYRRGGLNKLKIWKALGAKEVWFWLAEQELRIFVRRGTEMVVSARSELVPQVDPQLLVKHMGTPGQTAALKALREAVRKRRKR